MPIEGIEQPEILLIEKGLRLRKYDGPYSGALAWYQDEETLSLVDGPGWTPYDPAQLSKMYEYLNTAGELYYIEIENNGAHIPIGDVTLCRNDLPIVIGDKAYRGRGIGRKVLLGLIKRAGDLGFETLGVKEIYHHNLASQKLFEGAGFKKSVPSSHGFSYLLKLSQCLLKPT